MFYRTVDGSFSDTEVVLPSGQKLMAPALVEDPSGLRYLIVASETLPVRVWAVAKMGNIQGVIKPEGYGHGPKPRYVTRDYFEEQADLQPLDGLYMLPDFVWDGDMPEGYFDAQGPSESVLGPSELSSDMATSEAPSPNDDTLESLYVQLHTHSEHSALDGYSKIQEMVDKAVELGQKSLAITDHGNVAGHPTFQDVCEEAGIKPIFGMEAYFVPDRFKREDMYEYHHLVLWAMDDEGLQNLWAMSTESYRDGLYGKFPRLDWETLERFNKGVMASTACLRGPVIDPWHKGDIAGALNNLSRLKDIFGDRLYVELQINNIPLQMQANHWLVKQARAFEIPLVVGVDSHYVEEDEYDDHQVWLSMQTGRDVEDESSLFSGGVKSHMASDDEVIEGFLDQGLAEDVIIEAMQNSLAIAERCTAKIKPREGMPIYSVGDDAVQQDADRMLEMCFAAWEERTLNKRPSQEEYVARFEREAKLLIDKGFPGYFLMNADLVNYAKSNDVLVGPGRGSGAGSLVAYLMGITEVDPVENDLLFERFMTEGRTSLPDFDIDYPSSRKQFMIDYAQSRWGKNHVTAVGTHTRIKNKGAFKDTARAIQSRLPEDYFSDGEKISKIIGAAEASTAGLGLSWDELMAVAGDELEPYRKKMPYLFEMAAKFHLRLKTYSRHAAGLVIDPNCNLEEVLPMFLSSDGVTLVTQFDKDVLEKLNYVKFDFLNLRNLDTIQMTVDMIREQLGHRINVNKWRDEYNDQDVYDQVSAGWTLGIFQLETSLGTKTTKQLKPKNLADLSDVITLGRPGPIRSGLDKMYFRRREGTERVTFPDKRLETVLAKTYGAMLYQEDIMAVCLTLANYSSDEADKVRKILGKKKKELVAAEGEKFIARAVENSTDKTVSVDLWDQMAEFALYSFNRAHAFSYAILAYWTMWLKYHYPAQFMTACLSTIENDEIPLFISETRRLGYKILPPDINTSRAGFYNTDDTIRYGFESLSGIGEAASNSLIEGQPFANWEDFIARKGKCDMGQVKILAKIGAFDSMIPNRRALEMRLAEEDVKAAERCIFYRPQLNEFGLPCEFDWESEPAPLGRTGKPLKKKDPPKRCTKGCRQFQQRPLPSDDDVEPYTAEEIRNREMETMGVYLSSSPFDKIDPADMMMLKTADDLVTAENGNYLCAMIITSMKDHQTAKGDKMKFLKVTTPSGDMDIPVFSSTLDYYGQHIKVGQMGLAEVRKNDRGVSLSIFEPI